MKLSLTAFIFVVSFKVMAQQPGVLTLGNAIDLALKNNFDIRIARNDFKITQNNNHAGAAGMLPQVYLNVNDNPSLTNIRQAFSNGTEIVRNNVFANTFNANVALSYTLFDGAKMFATKAKLNEYELLGEQQLKNNIQNNINLVIQQYSDVVRQNSYLKVVDLLYKLGEERLSITNARQVAGLANNTDLYLAQLDLDTRKQALESQKVLIKNAYTDLNVTLNLPADSVYAIEETLTTETMLNKANLDSAFKQNPELKSAQSMLNIALYSQKEINAARLPQLKLNAAYGYGLSKSQAGFSLYNQNIGPSAGISLSVPIFTGNVNAVNAQNAKIQYQSSVMQQQQTTAQLTGSYNQAWESYNLALEQVQSDEKNVQIAKDYIDLMQKRFQLGQSTVLELKDAQNSYEQTYYRLISNKYFLKLAETDLLRLCGLLVK